MLGAGNRHSVGRAHQQHASQHGRYAAGLQLRGRRWHSQHVSQAAPTAPSSANAGRTPSGATQLIQSLSYCISQLKEQEQAGILQLATSWKGSAGQPEAQAALSQLHGFYTEWAALYDLSEGLAGLSSTQDGIQLLRLAGTLLLMDAQLLDTEQLLTVVVDARAVLSHQQTAPSATPASQALLQAARWLEHRMRVQGYHPVDASSYSAVLSRADRKQQLDKLRNEEKRLLAECVLLLHSVDASPEVDVSVDELASDPVLAQVARAQRAAGADAAVIHLTLPCCMSLLRNHPDAALREQVYELGLYQRGVQVLDIWSQLGYVRHKIARLYGHDSYLRLTHSNTLLGSGAAVLDFLAQLHMKLRPAAEQLGQQLAASSQQAISPWQLDYALMVQNRQPRDDPPDWQLCHLVAGVSELLKELLGVWLVPYEGMTQPHTTVTPVPPRDSAAADTSALLDLVCEHIHGVCSGVDEPRGEGQQQGQGNAVQVHGYTMLHEHRGVVGTLLIHSHLGKGARYLNRFGPLEHPQPVNQTQQQQQQQQSSTQAVTGRPTPPVVLIGLQPSGDIDPIVQLSWTVKELLHELGHALQYLLTWQPARGSRDGHMTVSSFLSAPSQLPLELEEVPSHLLELLITSPSAMHKVCQGAGRAAGHVAPEQLGSWIAAAARQAWYDPITLEQQVLSQVLDQQMCGATDWMDSRRGEDGGGKAVKAWTRLCTGRQSPHLPPDMWFSGVQLQGMQRALELQGKGYAYLAAWSLSAAAWEHHGLMQDACDPRAWRHLRKIVYEQDVQQINSRPSEWVEAVGGMGVVPDAHKPSASAAAASGVPRSIIPVPDQLLSLCLRLE